jgi:hypothetical protein
LPKLVNPPLVARRRQKQFNEGRNEMTFVTQWLQFEHSREWERRCGTKSKAESVAFDRIDERISARVGRKSLRTFSGAPIPATEAVASLRELYCWETA